MKNRNTLFTEVFRPFAMSLKFEPRCILFPLIILEMFLQLDLSPPVVNSIDCTWFGTAHTCAFSGPTVDSACHSKNQVKRSKELSIELRDRVVSSNRSGEGYQRSPRTEWPPFFLNGRSLEPPILFLELATQPNWAIGGEGPWSGRWPRTRWSLWQSSRVPL